MESDAMRRKETPESSAEVKKLVDAARTIADLDGAEHISATHLAEAIQYRNSSILRG